MSAPADEGLVRDIRHGLAWSSANSTLLRMGSLVVAMSQRAADGSRGRRRLSGSPDGPCRPHHGKPATTWLEAATPGGVR
jgi:hypothetical protein